MHVDIAAAFGGFLVNFSVMKLKRFLVSGAVRLCVHHVTGSTTARRDISAVCRLHRRVQEPVCRK